MYLFFLSTILSFLGTHANHLGKPVLKWLNIPTDKETELLSKKRQLLSEQSAINMVESFAKYSKIQRQINAIDLQLSEIQGERTYSNFKYRFFFAYGLRILIAALLLVLSIYYRSVPVFSVPRKFDLTPFTKVIAYPNKDNDVSFHFWVFCCSTLARLVTFTRS